MKGKAKVRHIPFHRILEIGIKGLEILYKKHEKIIIWVFT